MEMGIHLHYIAKGELGHLKYRCEINNASVWDIVRLEAQRIIVGLSPWIINIIINIIIVKYLGIWSLILVAPLWLNSISAMIGDVTGAINFSIWKRYRRLKSEG